MNYLRNGYRIFLLLFLISYSQSLFCQTAPEVGFTKEESDTILEKARRTGFTGTVLVMRGNKEVFHYNHGTTTLPGNVPLSLDTRYNIGSAGKPLTSVLIMQLVAQNKLHLDSAVQHYLAPITIPNATRITVRHLLSQTSGLGDFFDSPAYQEEKTLSIDDHLKVVQQMKLLSDSPGRAFLYSNSGFIVLGKLLENKYQMPYQQIVEEKLLQPAGIVFKSQQTNATGYRKEGDQWLAGEGNNPQRWTSAGGLFLSAKELHRIIHRVATNGYLPNAYKDTMWQKAIHPKGEPPFVHYALGWMAEEPAGLKMVGHNGGVRGFQMTFRYLPQSDLYLYVLSNRENGAEELFMDMLMLLIRKKEQGISR